MCVGTCCVDRRRYGCIIIRWVCRCFCVSFSLFVGTSRAKLVVALLSEAATVLARSSSVDVFDVRLRIYALSAIVVPESRNRQWHQYVLSHPFDFVHRIRRSWDDCYRYFSHFYLKFTIGLRGSLLLALFSSNMDCPV